MKIKTILRVTATAITLTACAPVVYQPSAYTVSGPVDNHPSSPGPHSGHGGPGEPDRETAGLGYDARPTARSEIPLQASRGGSYYLPVTVNETLSVPFLLDTGAEGLQIPLDVYLVLMRQGSIRPSDRRGSVIVKTADGSVHEQPRVVIHELRVGDRIVTDVLTTVSSTRTDALLGQSFLARLGSYTIDNRRHVLTLG